LAVSVAVIVNVPFVPVASEVARPYEPKELLIVTALLSDVQFAAVVQSSIVPFENVANAVNWCLVPLAMVGPEGDTVIDASVPPLLPQLMKPIEAAKSAATTILPYFRVFIILFSLWYTLKIARSPFKQPAGLRTADCILTESFFIFNGKTKDPRAFEL